MKVILDTNVYVSAAISSSAPRELFQHWINGSDFEVLVCAKLMSEINEVLLERPALRRWISLADAHLFIHEVQGLATTLPDPSEVAQLLRDLNDDFIIHFAQEQDANFVITGDKAFEGWDGASLRVDSPRTFVTLLEGGSVADYRWCLLSTSQPAMAY